MTKIVVTGGSGKAGRAVIKDLVEHGYEVLNVDLLPPRERISGYIKADLTDFGQAIEVLQGADGVVHLGAIPAPGLQPEAVTFSNNTLSTYNIFSAATLVHLKRVVWASSETTLGLPFEREKPVYAPIDEEHPLYPESSYALSKVISEEMARQFHRQSGISFVGLRFSNIIEPEQYINFPAYSDDPMIRKWNLWGYVDVRDVALSCRLGLEADIQGAEVCIIAAEDTVMKQTNRELMAAVFPGVPLRDRVGDFETLLSIKKAQNLLGYAPQYSWRQG